MKLGLGLYLNVLTCDNLDSPPQAGATHLVVHLVDYFAGASPALRPPLAQSHAIDCEQLWEQLA